MNLDDFRALGVAVLYAAATVFGLVGGCAVGVHQVLGTHKRVAFILAYAIIGAVAALGFMASTHVYAAFQGFRPANIHELTLYSMVVGGAVSWAVFSANQTVKVIFKRLGVEVQFTTRKVDEERRQQNLELDP